MKNTSFTLLLLVTFFAGCDRTPKPTPPPKIESVNDIPAPRNVGPPVQANLYDQGYKIGDLDGEVAAKAAKAAAPKRKPAVPADEELDVLALKAAGTNTERGEKWQRGYASGYREGFVRIAEGKR
jgi:hypothetical protein